MQKFRLWGRFGEWCFILGCVIFWLLIPILVAVAVLVEWPVTLLKKERQQNVS